MSVQREANTLACLHYRQEFGRGRVYRLRNLAASERSQRAAFNDALVAPALFGDDMTLPRFAELLDAGWRVKSTTLSDTYGWAQFAAQYADQAILLFALTDKGALRVASARRVPEPRAGWTIIALVPPITAEKAPAS
jgi:hypothetical protein